MTAKTEIMKYLKRVKNGKTGVEIAERINDYDYPTVKRTLSRMFSEGEVKRDENGYVLK